MMVDGICRVENRNYGLQQVSKRKFLSVYCTHAGANDPDDSHCSSLYNDRAEQGPESPQKSEETKCKLS